MGLFTHRDLLSVPVGTERRLAVVTLAIGRRGFPRPGLGAPSLAPAGRDGRNPPQPLPVYHTETLDGRPQSETRLSLTGTHWTAGPIGPGSSVLAGDNRHHYQSFSPFRKPSPRASWRISRCTIVISVKWPSPLRGWTTLRYSLSTRGIPSRPPIGDGNR